VFIAALSVSAALPTPLVNFRFSEPSGTTAPNAGSLAGEGTLVQPDGTGLPLFTNIAPTGPYAPVGNNSSIDLGAIEAVNMGVQSTW
jgi:hypothetical protein